MNENEINLMADIFDAISGADEWTRRVMEDKSVRGADEHFESVVDRARQYLPGELFNELDNARGHLAVAYGDAGIMYGLYVASVLRNIGMHSAELSELYAERENGGA